MNEAVTGSGLMGGRRGLIMGVANERSIAWNIAVAIAKEGGELAFTFQNESIAKRVQPLAASVGSDFVLQCDVGNDEDLDSVFLEIKKKWGALDFVVHAIAYSDKAELKGRYADTTRENFRNTMDISCFSFTNVARHAVDLMGLVEVSLHLVTLGRLELFQTIMLWELQKLP